MYTFLINKTSVVRFINPAMVYEKARAVTITIRYWHSFGHERSLRKLLTAANAAIISLDHANQLGMEYDIS